MEFSYVMKMGISKKYSKKQINETSIIRLGNGGADSFIFTAHRILCGDDSYSYEFHQLRKQLKKQLGKEAKHEKKVLLHGWIAKLSGIVAIGLTYIISKRYGSSHTLLYHRCNASGLGGGIYRRWFRNKSP